MIKHKYYDKYKRDERSRTFYKSREWKQARQVILQRDNHLCQVCLKVNKITPADMVHHIIELKDDWEKRLNEDNLVSLCNACHNKVHGIKEPKKVSKKIKVVKG